MNATLLRWRAIVGLSVTGALLAICGIPLVFRWAGCGRVVAVVAPISPYLFLLAGFVFGTRLLRKGASGWLRFARTALYPPTWLAGVLGAAATIVLVVREPSLRELSSCAIDTQSESYEAFTALIAIVAFAIIASAMIAYLAEEHRVRNRRPSNGDVQAITDERLALWIHSETPIQNSAHDFFGRADVARQLSELITHDACPTIAVVGPVGTGKTSLLNLALARVNANSIRRIRCTRVSLWPYNTTDAAIRSVLNAIIDEVAKEADVTSMRDIPGDYAAAIDKAAAGWPGLAFLTRTRSPHSILRDIELAVLALDIRLIVWVEDFERFAGIVDVAMAPEHLRVAPLRALLNELSDVKGLQIILASSAADFRFDIEKFARYVLAVPPLDPPSASRIISLARGICIRRHEVIDPVAAPIRTQIREPIDELGEVLLARFGTMTVDRALAMLASTPRVMKTGLRYAIESWTSLNGELDIDEVFIVSMIRSAYPSVFALINDCISWLRFGGTGDDKPEASAMKIRFDSLSILGNSKEALSYLLSFLFPGWDGLSNKAATGRPQGFASAHTDYWSRYASAVRPVLSDQYLLANVALACTRTSIEPLIEAFYGPRSEAAEAFAQQMLPRDLLPDLLVDIVKYENSREMHQWETKTHASPAVIGAWRLMLQSNPSAADLAVAVRAAFHISVGVNALLAYNIFYYFVSRDSKYQLLKDQTATGLSAEFAMIFSTRSLRDHRRFAASFAGITEPILLWMVWGLDRVRRREYTGLPFHGWWSFARVLLTACRDSPRTILPQLLPLIVDADHSFERDEDGGRMRPSIKYTFQRAVFSLFDVADLRNVLAYTQNVPLARPHAEMRAVALEALT